MIALIPEIGWWGEKDSNLRSSRNGFTVRPIWPLWNLPRNFFGIVYLDTSNHKHQKIEPLAGIEPATY